MTSFLASGRSSTSTTATSSPFPPLGPSTNPSIRHVLNTPPTSSTLTLDKAAPVPYPPDMPYPDVSCPLKKRRLRKIRSDFHAVRFPFFGPPLPDITKLTSLKILEHLSNKDLYSISTVSRLWRSVATDDALWY